MEDGLEADTRKAVDTRKPADIYIPIVLVLVCFVLSYQAEFYPEFHSEIVLILQ